MALLKIKQIAKEILTLGDTDVVMVDDDDGGKMTIKNFREEVQKLNSSYVELISSSIVVKPTPTSGSKEALPGLQITIPTAGKWRMSFYCPLFVQPVSFAGVFYTLALSTSQSSHSHNQLVNGNSTNSVNSNFKFSGERSGVIIDVPSPNTIFYLVASYSSPTTATIFQTNNAYGGDTYIVAEKISKT